MGKSFFIRPSTGEIIDANDAACTFYGYSKEEFKQMKIADINTRENSKIFADIKSVIDLDARENSKFFSFQHKLRNGEIRDVEVYTNKFDLFGEVVIFSQIVDVSRRKKMERRLAESEERFRVLVELSPYLILVCQGEKIIFANPRAREFYDENCMDNIIGTSVIDFIEPGKRQLAKIKLEEIQSGKAHLAELEAKIFNFTGRYMDVQISASYVHFDGKPCVQMIIKDITDEKKEMKRALAIQENSLDKVFPIESKGRLNYVWIPAKGVSGDFYCLHKVSKDCVVGIIGDVSGKGISAALSVSAIKVLFHDAVDITYDPKEIINYINKAVPSYLQEDYVAACCFIIDFNKGCVRAVGAGISEFLHSKKDKSWEKYFVEGPFLGMFEEENFNEVTIYFDKGDRLFFYSDGINEIFNDKALVDEIMNVDSDKGCSKIKDLIYKQVSYKDDCTCLIIDLI